MKQYPKARGLMAAWIRTQGDREDLVGELARAINTAPDVPTAAFREEPWLVWALAHGLTADHVEAMPKEYMSVPLAKKYAAYDKLREISRAQRAQCVLQ